MFSIQCVCNMKLFVVLLLVALAYAKHEKYIGWKSYFIGLSNDQDFKAFEPLINQYELDIISNPARGREGVVLVKPEQQEGLLQDLEAAGITYRVHADDLKRALDSDDERMEAYANATRWTRGGRQMPYDNYQRLQVIYDFIDSIGEQYPDIVKVVTPANSFEGRPIKYVKISTTNFEDQSKPVIFIDGGIHSREWLSPPTVTWAIQKLVENEDRELLERFDWILLPVVNPDGYEYSHVSDRFWRKTRSTESGTGWCAGVDGNRNYDFFWNTVGTSNNPCSEVFAGPRAFSEIETRVVRDLILEYLNRMPMYLTIHSFGSMILYPWGHDGSLSSNALGLHTVGIAMSNEIDQHKLPNFPNYIVGNAALVLWYGAAGASEDYAHLVGVPLSYTYELPGLSSGFNGFHLDPMYIEHVCRETWAGIVVGVKRAGDLWTRKMI